MAREAAAREAAAREEAARLRSERILQQERARDAEWRRHAAGPLPQLEVSAPVLWGEVDVDVGGIVAGFAF